MPDVYASDWSNAALGPSTGRIYVHSGRSGARLLTLTGEHPGDGFGTSPSGAGDVDGDGRADLIVGAWQYGQVAVSAGRVYLYSGRDGRLLRTYTDRVAGDTLGFDAVGLGDVDGDGTMTCCSPPPGAARTGFTRDACSWSRAALRRGPAQGAHRARRRDAASCLTELGEAPHTRFRCR